MLHATIVQGYHCISSVLWNYSHNCAVASKLIKLLKSQVREGINTVLPQNCEALNNN